MPETSAISNLGAERSVRQSVETSGRRRPSSGASRGQSKRQGAEWREELGRLFSGQVGLLRLIGARFLRRPGRFLGYTFVAALVGIIVINAAAMQSERHPAPFFAVAPAPVVQIAAVPMPPSRPMSLRGPISEAELAKQTMLIKDMQGALARRGYYIGQIDGQLSSRLDIAIKEFEKAAGLPVTGEPSEKLLTQVSASKLAMKDQLLVLIKDSTASTTTDRSKTNLQVQRALNKLGYGPVREDGVYGATTKASIEQFERDRRLAVRGEPNGRFLKELAASSGLAVE